jgi:hypothetical protein
MEIKMQILNKTLRNIEEIFGTGKGYILSRENPIYCPQVNGLTNLCLAELGYQNLAKKNLINFLKSPAFNKEKGLFYRETNLDGIVIEPALNSCKNSVMALALIRNGFKKEARKIMANLRGTPIYNSRTGLFSREYNSITGQINTLIITQSNLWVALAYISLNEKDKAIKIMNSLEISKYSVEKNLFVSQDCRLDESNNFYYLDDQALASLVYVRLGKIKKAKSLMKAVFASPFKDSASGLLNSKFSNNAVDKIKSTYKNSLMACALKELKYNNQLYQIQEGLIKELYDPKEKLFNQTTIDKTKVPDNSALALVALKL